MRPSELGISGTEVHWHPLVLMGAWLRVDGWYRSGNLAPEPELSRWRLHPEPELRKLGSELRAGTWRPSRWPQVPYPKKGACLRHYVLPTVRDQVAFMAYLVLLGPLLDSRVPNFVYRARQPLEPQYRVEPAPLQASVGSAPLSTADQSCVPAVRAIARAVSPRRSLDGGADDRRTDRARGLWWLRAASR